MGAERFIYCAIPATQPGTETGNSDTTGKGSSRKRRGYIFLSSKLIVQRGKNMSGVDCVVLRRTAISRVPLLLF